MNGRGREFESQRRILDGLDIFHITCCKRPKINEKEAGVDTFF